MLFQSFTTQKDHIISEGLFYLEVKYFIPIGTEFFPFVSSKEQTGSPRSTTKDISFGEEEIIDTKHMDHPESGEFAMFYQLSLNEESSTFDSYIVPIDSVIEN